MRTGSRVAVACILAFAALVTLLFNDGGRYGEVDTASEKEDEPVYEVMKRIRDVTPENIVQPPKIETELIERLPAVVPPPPPPRSPEPERWSRPIVLAAGIIKSGNRIIELAGIQPINLDQVCNDVNGNSWPCGMLARTEMRMFVRGRPIECDPVDDESAETITTRCRLASSDMSAWLVKNGWANPIADEFDAELQDAKLHRRGIWRETPPS